MRSLFTLVLLTLVVAVRASHDHKFIMGTPWYSEFLEEEDVMVEGSKFKSKRRKGNEGKMKEVSTKKKPMEKKDGKSSSTTLLFDKIKLEHDLILLLST